MPKHNGDLFKPQECDYTNFRMADLQNHMRKRTDDNNFKCDEFNYTSTTIQSFWCHLREHSGDLFKCGDCEYTSLNKTVLENHVRLEHTFDSFLYEQCDYAPLNERYIDRHKLKRYQ